MSKKIILTLSIISLIVAAVAGVGGDALFLVGLVIAFFLGLVLAFIVFSDAKERGKSPAFVLLPLFLGGIGGLIYYFIIKDSK